MVDFSWDSAAVWLEILGIHLRRCGAGCGDGAILGPAGLCRDSGVWANGDDFAYKREPSFQFGERIDWEGAAGAGDEAGGRWRDSDSRRRSGGRVLGRRPTRG